MLLLFSASIEIRCIFDFNNIAIKDCRREAPYKGIDNIVTTSQQL